jgi:Flp pilus assembly protein TadG
MNGSPVTPGHDPSRRRGFAPRRASQRGQATVEFALVLPILLTVLFAIAEMAVAFGDYIEVSGAARDGARAASVSRLTGNPAGAAVNAARASAGGVDLAQLGVTVDSTWAQGSLVRVTVTYPYTIRLYGMGVASGTLSSTTSMRVE